MPVTQCFIKPCRYPATTFTQLHFINVSTAARNGTHPNAPHGVSEPPWLLLEAVAAGIVCVLALVVAAALGLLRQRRRVLQRIDAEYGLALSPSESDQRPHLMRSLDQMPQQTPRAADAEADEPCPADAQSVAEHSAVASSHTEAVPILFDFE
jgi:hypothetical protein